MLKHKKEAKASFFIGLLHAVSDIAARMIFTEIVANTLLEKHSGLKVLLTMPPKCWGRFFR
ncbi:hypothetical protein [Vagococcus acidifermentans]|uniref:Uncharacterized protein n=1 Tax=Vagococcus acidifermentans TaxID=564710 RepID=A0A430ARE7_9ENTE|nr:hypothetical protein [Vagococcus acidifermentans]RSU10626.1 hypothetical protein CBF27_09920 [Vagococcus acidifermentans]